MNKLHTTKEINFNFVLSMAIPVFFEHILRILLGNVDQWMVNSYSSTAVAAIGNANQVINMGIIVLDMVCVAATIILAQHIGAKEQKGIESIFTLALGLIGILSVVMSVVLVVFRKAFFTAMHLPQELMPDAEIYLIIVGGGLCVQGFFMAVSAIFRSFAMMKEIMIVSFVINIINVMGNFVLINGYLGLPRLGVAGAALSTVIGRGVGLVLLIIFMIKRLGLRPNFKSLLHPDIKAIKNILRVGLPAAGDSISYNFMQMVMLSLINTFGTMAVTTKVYLGSILPFVYIFASSLATATQISVGYMVGKKETHKATRLVAKATVVAIIVSVIISIVLFIGSDTVFGIFTKDPAILSLIKTVLIVDLCLEMGRAVNMMMIRALLGAGDTAFPLYCALTSMWLVGVPLAYLLGGYFGLGLVGVWIGLAADEWFRACAFIIRWKSGKWKTKTLV